MPPPVDLNQKKQEQAALKKVVTRSFTANPHSVKTFGTTVISWSVTVPDSQFDISLKLNDQIVAAVGSKNFPLSQTTSFTLTASTENAGRQLGKLTVNVDASECQSGLVADSFLITQQLKFQFNNQFSGSTQVKLRGNGTEATLGDRTIFIGVPLEIEVPHWFNAEMSISVELAVSGGAPVKVSARSVSVDVSWSFFEHLASLGCTGFVQSGMEQLAQVFMSHIVDTELVPLIQQAFNDQASKFTLALKDADPQRRTYVTKSVVLSRDGLMITACPKA